MSIDEKKNAKIKSNLICGTIAGMASTVIGMPFDQVKIQIQTKQCKTIKESIALCYRNYGFQGFLRGLSIPFTCQGLIVGLQYSSYSFIKQYFKKENRKDWASLLISGGFCGSLGSIIVCPMEMIRINAQYYQKAPQEIISNLYKKNGFKGFYRGFGCTVIREGFAMAVYFSFYEKMQKMFPNTNKYFLSLIIGGFAGLSSWWFTYPLDLIKTKIQIDLKTTLKYEIQQINSFQNCFKGFLSCGVRAFPVNGVQWFIYESSKKFLVL